VRYRRREVTPIADLAAVEQRFIADMTRYLAAIDAGIAKAEEFAAANKAAQDAIAGIGLVADDVAVVVTAAMNRGGVGRGVAAGRHERRPAPPCRLHGD
jgi:hypothetical protein